MCELYGNDWKREMRSLRKEEVIDRAAALGTENEALRGELRGVKKNKHKAQIAQTVALNNEMLDMLKQLADGVSTPFGTPSKRCPSCSLEFANMFEKHHKNCALAALIRKAEEKQA